MLLHTPNDRFKNQRKENTLLNPRKESTSPVSLTVASEQHCLLDTLGEYGCLPIPSVELPRISELKPMRDVWFETFGSNKSKAALLDSRWFFQKNSFAVVNASDSTDSNLFTSGKFFAFFRMWSNVFSSVEVLDEFSSDTGGTSPAIHNGRAQNPNKKQRLTSKQAYQLLPSS